MNQARYRLAVAAAVLAAALAAAADSQTTQPAAPATTQAAVKIAQPKEFLELAAKARGLEGVHIKGRGAVTGEESELPPEYRQYTFEIWAKPPAAKTRLDVPSQEVRVCDGKHVYAYRPATADGPLGRRRKVTPANFYHAVDLAAVVLDSAAGYENLAASVKFVPTDEVAEHAKGFPGLKWFALESVAKPGSAIHHLLKGTSEVRMGISPKDGLMRVSTAKLEIKVEREDGRSEVVRPVSSVFFETVRAEKIRDEEFKLPAAALEAQWTDADTGKPIPAPKEVIAEKKP